MSYTYDSNLLEQPIEELRFSEKFKECCRLMEYTTLKDLIEASPQEMFDKSGFNYNWLGELVEFLSENQLIYLLQPLPGRSPEKN